MPHIKHNKGKVEGQKLKIQEIFSALDAQSAPFDGTLPIDYRDTVTTDSGALLALP